MKLRVVIGVLVAIIAITIVIIVIDPGYVTAFKVVSKDWRREIAIEKYSIVPDSNWCSSNPADAYDIVVSRKKSGSVSVKVGKIPVSIPIYNDWCDYKLKRWVVISANVSEGDQSTPPSWGNPNIKEQCEEVGCLREGTRTEYYYIQLESVEQSRTIRCEMDFNRWNITSIGLTFDLKIHFVSNSPSCRDIPAH